MFITHCNNNISYVSLVIALHNRRILKMEYKDLLKVLDGILGAVVLTTIGLVFMIFDGKLRGEHGAKTSYTV